MTNNQASNNTGSNGNSALPAARTSKVNVAVFSVRPDHLGTRRVITASTALAATTGTGITSAQTVNKAVWRWDSDPLGSNATANSAPNENPNTLSLVVGTDTLLYLFGFDLAFPGQKRDRDTGKHYNYFRDYYPAVGRYVESNPIGLRGGLSTFGYVKQRPMRFADIKGLIIYSSSCRSENAERLKKAEAAVGMAIETCLNCEKKGLLGDFNRALDQAQINCSNVSQPPDGQTFCGVRVGNDISISPVGIQGGNADVLRPHYCTKCCTWLGSVETYISESGS